MEREKKLETSNWNSEEKRSDVPKDVIMILF